MSEADLRRSEDSTARGWRLMNAGDAAGAYAAFQEAAEYMMRFAAGEQGQRKKKAQQLTEQLILKARQARDAAGQAKRPTSVESSTSPAAGKPEEDNHSAISRDLRSIQRGEKATSDPEARARFAPVESPNVHFSDIAGLETVKRIVQMKVIEPILHPELYERFNKTSNGGILLYGPPGTGKTMIARAIATETNLAFFSVRCSDIVGKRFGDGERNLHGLFDAARETGRAMIFFDEFESLACKRGSGSTVMNRIVPELLSQMDGFQQAEGTLIVLAATNRPWDLDSAVLRPPRMAERIYVGLPDFEARRYIVEKALEPLPKQELLQYDGIAEALDGCNCADIIAFVERVKEAPIRRGLTTRVTEQYITPQDVEEALNRTRSSVQKADLEAFSKWEATQQ